MATCIDSMLAFEPHTCIKHKKSTSTIEEE